MDRGNLELGFLVNQKFDNVEKSIIMSRTSPLMACRLLPIALAGMVYCGAAMAEISDTIHPFVMLGYTYDDNLLRLPDDYFGIEQRSDRATQAQAGIVFARPIGRQKLSGSAKVSRVTFDHFQQLDYNGKDFNADLAWELGNHLQGKLGGSYVQTLTPFSDYQSQERNLRTQRRQYVNGAWRLHPSWQLRSGFYRNKFDYELQSQRVNNRNEDLAEAGGDYVAASGSRIGLVARRLKGSYLSPQRVNGFAIQDDYVQDELKLNVDWRYSGVTQVQMLVGYAKRKRDVVVGRDASGANGRVSVQWAPFGKLRFGAEAWREFAAVESTVVSNSLNKGASVNATWDISAKVQGSASLRKEKRDFEQFSNVVLVGDPSDSNKSATLGLLYAPKSGIQLNLSAFREQRDGSPFGGRSGYTSNGATFNISAQF